MNSRKSIYPFLCEKRCLKPLIAPEGAAWNLMHQCRLRVKIWWCGVRKKRAYQTSVSSSLLEATLAATHQNLQPNCWQLSCIVGNVGARFSHEIEQHYLWSCPSSVQQERGALTGGSAPVTTFGKHLFNHHRGNLLTLFIVSAGETNHASWLPQDPI